MNVSETIQSWLVEKLERDPLLRISHPRSPLWEVFLAYHCAPIIPKTGIVWIARFPRDIAVMISLWKCFEKIWPQKISRPRLLLPSTPIDPESIGILTDLLFHPRPFILASPSLQNLPDPKELKKLCKPLSVSTKETRDNVINWLSRSGYERVKQLTYRGSFLAAGENVFIFPWSDLEPIRISFNESGIESIMIVHQESLKPRDPLSSIVIPPSVLPKILPRLTDFTSFIQSHHWVIADEQFQSFSHSGIRFSIFHRESHSPSFKTPSDYSQFPQQLSKECLQTAVQGKLIVITRSKKSVLGFFNHYSFPSESIIIGEDVSIPRCKGFLWPGFVSVLTDYDLFSQKKISPFRKTKPLLDIHPGDYIVHLYHGIGIFKNFSVMTINGIEREYFEIHYQGKDRLYVPVEMSDRIDRYIGRPNPPIHSLRHSDWIAAIAKAQSHAKDIGFEILSLQAKRELATVTPLPSPLELEHQLSASFLFQETEDQRAAIQAIDKDLQDDHPMDRLVLGDVGFGKTEIAVRTALKCAMNGLQVAVLSPTTILTQQHVDTFKERLEQFPVRIEMLSRWQPPRNQKKILIDIEAGSVDIVIGTHRLLSRDVHWKNLGLIIIDEEQRFGVKQKERLKKFRTQAHILCLSATPIPRTLHMSLFGMKDLSLLSTPLPSRKAIDTVIKPYDQDVIRQAIERELARHGQTYVLHNRVKTIGWIAKIIHSLVPSVRVGIAHGQLHAQQLASVIQQFDHGAIDVLVCSTIIENGLDLKNVNTLIIPDISLFGLSQLYQIRGRVGRSDRQAYAVLLYPQQKRNPELNRRIDALMEDDGLGQGLRIAMRDMEIRGIGNLLGSQQHGHIDAIGLSLYLNLLEHAVATMAGEKSDGFIRDIQIDLPISALIPKSYCSNELERMRLYYEMTRISDLSELLAFKQQRNEQKSLPKQFLSLFDLCEIKILCQNTAIISITSFQKQSNEQFLSLQCQSPIPFDLAQGWELKKNGVIRKKIFPNEDWITDLKHFLNRFHH